MSVRYSRNIVALLALPAIVALAGCPKSADRPAMESASDLGVFEKIHANYHGLPLDNKGQVIELTLQQVEDSIRRINKKMGATDAAKSKAVVELDAAITAMRAEKLLTSEDEASLAGLRAELLLEADKRFGPSGRAANFALLREVYKGRPQDKGMQAASTKRISSLIEKYFPRWAILERWRGWELLTPVKLRYCVLNGVPQPPDWGSPSWVRRSVGGVNTVPANALYILNDPAYTTQVWTYSDPNGGCIALPRKNGGSTTQGVICQNANTGNACFWDNRPHAGGATFSDAEMAGPMKSIVNDWVNGNDAALSGGGKCVQCHRGENAFVLHAETILSNDTAMPFDTNAAVWYTMINSLGWTNPPKTNFATGGGCTTCHDIGSTTVEQGSYCSILQQAANREMPDPASPASWNPPNGSAYKAHIDAMKANGC